MRIFSNCLEAVKEIERDLVEMGTDVRTDTYQNKNVKDDPRFHSKELTAYLYTITGLKDEDLVLDHFGLEKRYAHAELHDRLRVVPVNPGESYLTRKDVWEQFLRPDGRFDYTYSERMSHQWETTAEILVKHPRSRQGIVCVYDHIVDTPRKGGKGRVPCSMFFQFMERLGALNLVYVMRSCDFYTHFGYDTWLAISLLKEMAKKVNLPVGHFTHFISSLHAFAKDYESKGIF